MTFSLDELTAARIATLARDTGRSKSAVVRDAVAFRAENQGRVSEEERVERVRVFRGRAARLPPRPQQEVEAELREIRAARRGGGRVSGDGP